MHLQIYSNLFLLVHLAISSILIYFFWYTYRLSEQRRNILVHFHEGTSNVKLLVHFQIEGRSEWKLLVHFQVLVHFEKSIKSSKRGYRQQVCIAESQCMI